MKLTSEDRASFVEAFYDVIKHNEIAIAAAKQGMLIQTMVSLIATKESLERMVAVMTQPKEEDK